MNSIEDAVDQGAAAAAQQLVERYASVLLGQTRQAGPATAQDDLADLFPSQDAIGVATDGGNGAVVIVMMTPAFVAEIARAIDPEHLTSAVQPVFDQLATSLGLAPSPVRPVVGAAQLSECIGDRPLVLSAGVFTGETIDATVSVATFVDPAGGAPAQAAPDQIVAAQTAPAPASGVDAGAPADVALVGGAARNTGLPTLDPTVLRRGLQLLADVHLDVTAQLGRAELTVSQVLDLTPGSVIELDKVAGAPLDLYVNGSLFARADVIVVDGAYAVQIVEIIGDGTQA